MKRFHGTVILLVCAALAWLCASRAGSGWSQARRWFAATADAAASGCPSDNSGLKLPAGFCATIFADGIGHARELTVAANGVVYVNTWSGRYYGNDKPHDGGFLVALQDKSGSGKADDIERFGESVATGGAGGSGVALYKDSVYAEINDRIVKYPLTAGSIAPAGAGVTILSGLPLTGDHPMHPFVIDSKGQMFIDVASPSNACQKENRTAGSPGIDPCPELATRGGVWLYDANKTGQKFSPAERYATGIRNGEGFAFDGAGRLYVTQHGRDQLHANWPDLYKPEEEATLPAEEFVELKKGGDYGWPECYFDPFQNKLVLAPEYGGDGGKKVGVCADKIAPVAAFPAHWAPNSMVHYDKKKFPERYRTGMFIAFHGSWDRAPYVQGGYNVTYQPLSGDRATGQCEIFADGFAGADESPAGAAHRPSGLAVSPDGALYVSDDQGGRIYKIVYLGGAANSGGAVTPCPSAASPAGAMAAVPSKPPEGVNPDAGKPEHAGNVPEGATPEMVALGDQIYHGQVAGATCTGCHGANAKGTPLGPDLTGKTFLWSDGSYAALAKTITEGVSQPKKYRAPMPPMGGAQLTPDQVNAVAAYIWRLSH